MQLAILGLGVGLIVMLFRRRRAATAGPAGYARTMWRPSAGRAGLNNRPTAAWARASAAAPAPYRRLPSRRPWKSASPRPTATVSRNC
uniref:Uncharacterized protein n=1 Tax=Phenylobacterium glaciei TaxID=2803784 RepID=A0A974P6F9_9CAUL|nr:hypothetical protein JKL49_09385 [Phenylobacterium glaciei]